MRIRFIASGVVCAALMLGSCSTPKNITYFQDVADGATVAPQQQLDIRVRPEDKLSIIVTTQDPALSNLFNLVRVQTKLGNTTSSTTTASNSSDGNTSCYTVDSHGDINFPVLGRLHIGGMTRQEVAAYIEERLRESELVKDPIVTLEFANTGISVIGEVARAGRYEFNKDRMSILDAIAMAGDLTPTGQRENVVVLREDGTGRQRAYRIDLTDMASVAASPAYYLQQNDVIYVEPNDKKKRDTTASGNSAYSPSFWVTIGSLGVSIATLIVTLTR